MTDREQGGEKPIESDDRPGGLAGRLERPAVPAALEARVVATLTARGMLAPAGAGRWLRRAVLPVAAFLAGAILAPTLRSAPAPDERPRFVLLLYEPAAGATAPAEEARRVDEIRSWIGALRARGHRVSGEKLAATARLIDAAGSRASALAREPEGAGTLSGLFIVSAEHVEEASAIARSCPMLRYGGRVVVRPIEPT